MSLPVVLRRKAQAEFDPAIDWFERQQPGLEIEAKSGVTPFARPRESNHGEY